MFFELPNAAIIVIDIDTDNRMHIHEGQTQHLTQTSGQNTAHVAHQDILNPMRHAAAAPAPAVPAPAAPAPAAPLLPQFQLGAPLHPAANQTMNVPGWMQQEPQSRGTVLLLHPASHCSMQTMRWTPQGLGTRAEGSELT